MGQQSGIFVALRLPNLHLSPKMNYLIRITLSCLW